MADLSDVQAAGSTKIIGSDATGLETTPVAATTSGGLHSNIRTNNGTEIAYNHGVPDAATVRVAAQLGVGGTAVSDTVRVPATDILNIGIATSEKTATATAAIARVGVANLVGRKAIEIVNTSTVVIYVGASNVAVTGANRGRPINPKGSFSLALAPNVDLYIIAASNATYVVTEVG